MEIPFFYVATSQQIDKEIHYKIKIDIVEHFYTREYIFLNRCHYFVRAKCHIHADERHPIPH